jgi:hypothetical protein
VVESRSFLKGDTAASFLVNDKNCTDLNFSYFFCEMGLKMLGPQQWQLLHVEKDDQVIRHNNNKTWGDQKVKHPESIFVQNISEKLIERLR